MAEALHLRRRVLDQHGVIGVGGLGERDAHQQPTVAAAADAEVWWTRHAVFAQFLGDSREVVVDALTVLFQTGAMPLRPEFAPAANVGEHEDTTALQPRRACVAAVGRSDRDLESAVPAEQLRISAVVLHASAIDDEERDSRTILRRCFQLIYYQLLRVKHLRETFGPQDRP